MQTDAYRPQTSRTSRLSSALKDSPIVARSSSIPQRSTGARAAVAGRTGAASVFAGFGTCADAADAGAPVARRAGVFQTPELACIMASFAAAASPAFDGTAPASRCNNVPVASARWYASCVL